MLKTLCTITAMTVLLATGTAFAKDDLYLKFIGKYTRMGDMDITDQVQLDSEEGYGFGAAAGWHVDWLKVEAEVATQKNDINNFEVKGIGGNAFKDADTRIDTLLLNAYVDVPVAGDFSVYAGGGLGGAIVTFSAYDYDVDETVFAYKLAAGVSYAFTDTLGAEIGYEYLATDDIESKLLDIEDISSSNVVFAFKVMF